MSIDINLAHDLLKVLLRIALSCYSFIWFFHPIENRSSHPLRLGAGILLITVLSLVLDWPNHFWPYIDIRSAFVRLLLYASAAFLYLQIVKKGSMRFKLHYSLLLSLIHTTRTNIFMIPPFSDIRTERLLISANPVLNVFFVHLLQFFVLAVMFRIMKKACDFHEVSESESIYDLFYLAMSFILVYMKQAMKDNLDASSAPLALSETAIYYYALILFSFSLLYMLENVRRTERHRRNLVTAITLQNYQYQSLLDQTRMEEKLSCMRHDMKNHLLAIKNLSAGNEEVAKYIDDMQAELDESRIFVDTGNPMINGLLAQKLKKAAANDIRFNINMNLREADFMKAIDLCTIVGNALDNAIEASLRVADPDKRHLHIRSRSTCGCLTFRFMNYFEHELVTEGTTFLTSKEDKEHHGLGMMSIRYALEQYEGTLSTEVDENHYFILKITIPIP